MVSNWLLAEHETNSVFDLQGDVEEDEMIPDKESDIKPRFHRAKSHSQKHQASEEVRFK